MIKLEIFDALLNNGVTLNEKSFKIMEADQEPEKDEPKDAPKEEPKDDEEMSGVSKEFLGSREGVYYYLVDEEGESDNDIIVQDQEETKVFSAKEHDLDIEDKLGFIIAAAQDLGMEYLTFSVFQKYALPVIQGEEEFEENLDPDEMIAKDDEEAPEVPDEAENALGDMPKEDDAADEDPFAPAEDEEDDKDKKKDDEIKDSVTISFNDKEYVLEHVVAKDGNMILRLNGRTLGLSEANVDILTAGSTAENKLETLAKSLAGLYEKKLVEGKDPPTCSKCNKAHWAFNKCDGAGEDKKPDEDDKAEDKDEEKKDDVEEGVNPDPNDKEDVKIKKLQEKSAAAGIDLEQLKDMQKEKAQSMFKKDYAGLSEDEQNKVDDELFAQLGVDEGVNPDPNDKEDVKIKKLQEKETPEEAKANHPFPVKKVNESEEELFKPNDEDEVMTRKGAKKREDGTWDISEMDGDSQIAFLADKYMPRSGNADTVEGEILRAVCKLKYRLFNDGDYWWKGYGTETAGPAAAFLKSKERVIPGMTAHLDEMVDASEDDNEAFMDELCRTVADHIHPMSKEDLTPNTEDMLDFKAEYQPDYDDRD